MLNGCDYVVYDAGYWPIRLARIPGSGPIAAQSGTKQGGVTSHTYQALHLHQTNRADYSQ
jgi:hypothetical protein